MTYIEKLASYRQYLNMPHSLSHQIKLSLHLPLWIQPYFSLPLDCPKLLDSCLYSFFLLPYFPFISQPTAVWLLALHHFTETSFIKVTNNFLRAKRNGHLSTFVLASQQLWILITSSRKYSSLNFHNSLVSWLSSCGYPVVMHCLFFL